jgi:hypothetical protein
MSSCLAYVSGIVEAGQAVKIDVVLGLGTHLN